MIKKMFPLLLLSTSLFAGEVNQYIGKWEVIQNKKKLTVQINEDGTSICSENGRITKGHWSENEDGTLNLTIESTNKEYFQIELNDKEITLTEVKHQSKKTRSINLKKSTE